VTQHSSVPLFQYSSDASVLQHSIRYLTMQPIPSLFVEKAKSLGFLAVGFTGPGRPLHFDRFTAWLAEGKNADMAWLRRNLDVREDPSKMLRNCRAVISLAYPYPARKPETADGFSVARYANPVTKDYHTRLRMLCGELVSFIKGNDPGSRSRICVDSAPLMERSIAAAAGIGFIGKNNLLIIPGYGSYLYLAEILTTAAILFPPLESFTNQCGSCSLCLDACPTGALERPFVLDASRCLSYLTVEDKGGLKAALATTMGKCFFGCDRCQEVCPFNRERHASDVVLPSTDVFLGMEEETFERDFGRTALARAGLEKLKGNIYAARKGR
jgi:epoxyqueuosine reductase